VAHKVSDEVFTPGFLSRGAKTEKGTELDNHTAEDVTFILQLLAYNNTRFVKTVAQLEKHYGISIHPTTLKKWVSSLFVERYVEIQNQLANKLNEKIGNQLVDAADQAIEVQVKAIEETKKKLEDPNEIMDASMATISLTAKNMSDVASKNIEKTQLLRDKPTQIHGHQNPDDALEVLREMGLLKDKPKVIDSEVVDEEES
jgi:predicted phage tail protein